MHMPLGFFITLSVILLFLNTRTITYMRRNSRSAHKREKDSRSVCVDTWMTRRLFITDLLNVHLCVALVSLFLRAPVLCAGDFFIDLVAARMYKAEAKLSMSLVILAVNLGALRTLSVTVRFTFILSAKTNWITLKPPSIINTFFQTWRKFKSK